MSTRRHSDRIAAAFEQIESKPVHQVLSTKKFHRVISISQPWTPKRLKSVMKAHDMAHRLDRLAWYFKAGNARALRRARRKYEALFENFAGNE